MLAILIDRKIKEVCSYSGYESILEMSVLTGTLYDHFSSELKSIGVNNIKIINDDNYENEIGDINEDILIFFSNIFLEFSQNISFKDKNEFLLVSKTGDIGGIYCPQSNIKSINLKEINKLKIEKRVLIDFFFEINNLNDYKALIRDILDRKCYSSLPKVAEGVYAINSIPKGDFVIVPPVFLDDDIQIEDGCTIGPYTAVLNSSLIAKNSCIKNTFMAENSFVSSNCFVEDSLCFENSSICRNSAVFSGCVIGNGAIINEDTFLENNSVIMPFMRVKSEKNSEEKTEETNNSQAMFYGLNPEKAALLGGAVGNVFKEGKIAVLSDGEKNSTALKLSLIGGLMTTGAEVFDFGSSFFSSIYYYLDYCQLDCGVFISGKINGTAIYVIDKNKEFLSRSKRAFINSIMREKNINRCSESSCKNVRQIHGMQRMYIQHLIKDFEAELNVFPVFNCNNERLKSAMEIATSKIPIGQSQKRLEFIVNEEGSMLNVKDEYKTYSHKDIIQIVACFLNKKSTVSYDELWRYDAVYLSFMLMKILSENNIDIHNAIQLVPSFYITQQEIDFCEPFSKFLLNFKDNDGLVFKNNEFAFKKENSKINIKKISDKKMKIIVNGCSMEVAEEILVDILKILDGSQNV